MTRKQVEIGGVYHARISGRFVHVRVDRIEETFTGRKSGTRYHATNLMTGRHITFRSASKLRGKVIPPAMAKEVRVG